MSIWVVTSGNGYGEEIGVDSVWSTEKAANEAARALNEFRDPKGRQRHYASVDECEMDKPGMGEWLTALAAESDQALTP